MVIKPTSVARRPATGPQINPARNIGNQRVIALSFCCTVPELGERAMDIHVPSLPLIGYAFHFLKERRRCSLSLRERVGVRGNRTCEHQRRATFAIASLASGFVLRISFGFRPSGANCKT